MPAVHIASSPLVLNLVHSRLFFVGFALVPIVAGLAQTSGSYTVRALIGSGSRGDGGPAVSALLDGPYGLAEDAQGNVYISESNRGVIRRVGANGIIQQFAGSGILDDGPQGQPALQTDLISPGSLLIDSDGGLIFADNGACRIRKVLPAGMIQDLVGTGRCAGASAGFPGGGSLTGNSPALQTDIGAVGGMVKDSSAQLLFSDASENVVWRLGSDGILRIVAGTGSAGFGGDSSTATSAYLNRRWAWQLTVAATSISPIPRIAGSAASTLAGSSLRPLGTARVATLPVGGMDLP